MQTIHRQGIFIATLALGGLFSGQVWAMRYVKVVVSMDGKPILEASTGDRGDQDADEVWSYLDRLTFRPTAEFAATVPASEQQRVLESRAAVGQEGQIVIDMPYDGRANTRRLKLIRVPRDDFGREWKLDSEEIEKLSKTRLITRRQAAELKNPKAANP
jgi:hypothetical protein